jgi:hypothetical protein
MAHSFRVSSVSFSGNGRYIVSGAHDNTTRLWNAETGKEIASFIDFADEEWIVITRGGYYNASPRGDEYLNVRIGDTIYEMDQFSAIFYQSEVVNARLKGLPDPAVVSLTGGLRMAMVPPSIDIRAPGENDSGSVEITVFIKDRFRPVLTIQIVINGRLLGQEELRMAASSKKLAVENTRLVVKEPANELSFSINVNLDGGSNYIQVIAANAAPGKDSAPEAGAEGREAVYVYNSSGADGREADLWVLAIGSNSYLYGKPENDLKYSVNNAKGISALFESQRGKRFRNVRTRIIADGEETAPTRANILNGIDGYFNDAQPDDALVLYLSGHGDDKDEGYCFLPQDVPFTSGEPDYSQGISLDDIGALLDKPGRKFIFIDSCFSGGVDSDRLTRSLKNQSTVIFTSSLENEKSWEGSGAVGYGVFTESLITGIGGAAAVNNGVGIQNLGDYVSTKVALLSGDRQHPYIYIPEGFFNFTLAKVR